MIYLVMCCLLLTALALLGAGGAWRHAEEAHQALADLEQRVEVERRRHADAERDAAEVIATWCRSYGRTH